MVKESNSVRSKKLHSSKPYDVSNSFVKKVTSHVTNLLPQPAWLSKWFTSMDGDGDGHRRDALNSNESDSEEEEDKDEVQPPPSKRAKIPLNLKFHPNSFNISPVINDEADSHQRAGPSRMVTDNFVIDGAVAGPSGINTRPHLVSSTPNIQSPAANLLSSGTERKLNGDDRSETSESTSGCSSLVPQANRQFQANETTVTNNLSSRRRSIDEKLNFTGHLQNARSLFSDRRESRSPQVNSSLSRRRPSFNVSAFGSPGLLQDRATIRNRIVTSPFYAGKTTYGGASAYRRGRDGFSFSYEAGSIKRSGVQVRPVNCESETLSSMATMSSTARRILETLEQLSTPVNDAKRIPVQTQSPLGSKRKRLFEAGPSLSPRVGQPPRTPNSIRPLPVPTVPDLLKLRNREKLQDTMEAARLIAASNANTSTSSNTLSSGFTPSSPNRGYRLRSEEDEKSGKPGGKIRAKQKELEEERVEEVNLPNIALPVTSLPKFDFVVPPATSTPPVICTFKFTSPITVTENTRTCSPLDEFTFSKPLSIGSKNTINHHNKKNNFIDTSIPNSTKLSEFQFKSPSGSKLVLSEKRDSKNLLHKNNSQSSDTSFGIKPATELKSGSVMDILGKGDSKDVSSSSSISLDKFKPAPGMWECSVCMLGNKSDVSKCICCKTPRTAVSAPSSVTASSSEMWECRFCHTSNAPSSSLCIKCSVTRGGKPSSQAKELRLTQEKSMFNASGFGNKFKPASNTWECTTCLVRNPESSTQCMACETKKPGLANNRTPLVPAPNSLLAPGFGDKFKKPEGVWECPDCMVQNKADSLKCVACTRAKPGTEAKASTTKFNIPMPAEASGFKFGIDKAGETSKEPMAPVSSSLGFKFGETKMPAATTFSFGVNPSISNSDTAVSSTGTTPTFSFGTMAFASPTSDSNKKSEDTSPLPKTSIAFGVPQSSPFQASPSGEFKKPASVTKKRHASDSNEATVDSVSSKSVFGGSPPNSILHKSDTKKEEYKSEPPTKKVTFSFGSSSGPTTITSEKPNASTNTAENAKPTFAFNAPASLNFSSGKPPAFSFTSTSSASGTTLFGNAASNTTASAASSTSATISSNAPSSATATVTSSTPPDLIGSSKTIAAFGSSSSSISVGQPSTTTSLSTPSFATALKTTTSAPVFSFGSEAKAFAVSKESATPKSQASVFGTSTTAVKPFGVSSTTTTTPASGITFGASSTTAASVTFGAPSTTTTSSGISFGTPSTTAASNVAFGASSAVTTTASVSPFGAPSSTPGFSLVPSFVVPSTKPSVTATTTSMVSFGNTTAPNFSSGFSSLTDGNKQVSKSTASPAPFTFGSNASNPPSSLGTAAPFSFNSAQNNQGLANKGTFGFAASSGNTALTTGTSSLPAASTGFSFGTPTFNFGTSTSSTPNPAAPSLLGSAMNNNTPAPTAAPVFGASTAVTFGAVNPTAGSSSSTGFNAPNFNFGASGAQPSSSVFSFGSGTASGTTNAPALGSTNTPAVGFSAASPSFSFGQQTQTPALPAPPTFNPNVRPQFNFTGGETPIFTAAAAPGAPPPGPIAGRRIKKAVRKIAPR